MKNQFIEQLDDLLEKVKELPVERDFFKELMSLCHLHIVDSVMAFREEWVESYKRREFTLTKQRTITTMTSDSKDSSQFLIDEDGWNMSEPASIEEHTEFCKTRTYSKVFKRCAMLPITDTHREFIVAFHARGLSTEMALASMVHNFPEFEYLVQYVDLEKWENGISVEMSDSSGPIPPLFDRWKSAFSYLRPTHSRWPEKKYGALWRETKEVYEKARMVEFRTTKASMVANLAEAVEKAQMLVRSATELNFDKRVKSLIALSTALHKFLPDEDGAWPEIPTGLRTSEEAVSGSEQNAERNEKHKRNNKKNNNNKNRNREF